MPKKVKPELTGITLRVVRDYMDTGKSIERAAEAVIEALMDNDRDEVIFQTISRENGLSEVKLLDVRVEREYKDEKVPKMVEVPRVLVRVQTTVGRSESVWFDAYLLNFHGKTLNEEVKKYIERITGPAKARRKAGEIRHMHELIDKYPEDAVESLKATGLLHRLDL
jgi:hypothetical protein